MKVLKVIMIEGQAVLDAAAVEEIGNVIRGGGLVVYPTDTVYGLGADPASDDALRRLFSVKQRPAGQPVSVVVPDVDAAKEMAVISPSMEGFLRQWAPGAITFLFRSSPKAPPSIVSAQGLVAIRVPKHPVPLMLAKRFGPITATSANLHGRPPAVECAEAQEQLGDAVDLYVDAGPCPVGRESTVIDGTGPEPRIIREGAVSAERLGLVRRRS